MQDEQQSISSWEALKGWQSEGKDRVEEETTVRNLDIESMDHNAPKVGSESQRSGEQKETSIPAKTGIQCSSTWREEWHSYNG